MKILSSWGGKVNKVSRRHRGSFMKGVGKSFFSRSASSRSSKQGQSGKIGF